MMKGFSLLVLVLALCGCIEVADFGKAWDAGKMDPALEGRWLIHPLASLDGNPVQDRYVTFTRAGDHYRLRSEDNEAGEFIMVRTLEEGGRNFLMLYEPKEPAVQVKSGDLWPYAVKGGKLEMLRLKPSGAEEIEKMSGGLVRANTIGEVTQFGVKDLDREALAALDRLAGKASLWEVWATGEKAAP